MLQSGANPRATTPNGNLTIDFARKGGNQACAQILKAAVMTYNCSGTGQQCGSNRGSAFADGFKRGVGEEVASPLA